MAFDKIDTPPFHFFAIDGSRNSHVFYNGISICFYQAGYVCFHKGQQVRLSGDVDPVVLGKLFHGTKMLVINEKDIGDIYDEFLPLPVVKALISFCEAEPGDIFPSKQALTITST